MDVQWESQVPGIRAIKFEGEFLVRAYVLAMGPAPVLVDAGSAEGKDLFLARLAELDREPAALIITHGHIDHVGCAPAVLERFRCPLVCHEAEVQRLVEGGARVSRTFRDGEEVVPGVRAVHVPGHTEGNSALLLADQRVLIAGDVLLGAGSSGGQEPVNPPPEHFCVDAAAARRNLRRLLDLDFDVCLMSHGAPILSGARAYVQALVERIA